MVYISIDLNIKSDQGRNKMLWAAPSPTNKNAPLPTIKKKNATKVVGYDL